MPVGIVARFEKQPDEIKPFAIPLHKTFLGREDQPVSVQVFLPGLSITYTPLISNMEVDFVALTGGIDGGDYDGTAYVKTTANNIEEFDFVMYVRATPSQMSDNVTGPSALESANAAAASAIAAANSAAQAAASAQAAQTAQQQIEDSIEGAAAAAAEAAQQAVAGSVSAAAASATAAGTAKTAAETAATNASGSATAAAGSATTAAGHASAAQTSATAADNANQAAQAAKGEVDADRAAAETAASAAAGSAGAAETARAAAVTARNQAEGFAQAAAASAAEAAAGGGSGGGGGSENVDYTDIVWDANLGVALTWKQGGVACSATYETLADGSPRQLTETIGAITRTCVYDTQGRLIALAPAA